MASTRQLSLPIRQLAILALCRFCQPFAIASVFAYFPEYVEYLGIESEKVSIWVGILAATFNAGECLSAFPCAFLADRFGRRPVLIITLLLSVLANLGIGFCSNIPQAFICIIVAGLSNGNVAVMRTSVAELVPSKDLQAKAFSFLPTAAGIGTIIGPIIGGNLARPVNRYPALFAGISLLRSYPFALPTVVSAIIFLPALLAAIFALDETLRSYTPLSSSAADEVEDVEADVPLLKHPDASEHSRLSIEISEDQTLDQPTATLNRLSHVSNIAIWINSICGLHSVAFDHLLPVFLHYPDNRATFQSLLRFSFGFGRDSQFIGTLLTVAGVFGMATTIFAVPQLLKRFGNRGILRIAMLIFPIIYLLFPWSTLPPHRLLRFASLIMLLLLKVAISVAALQSCLILITNSVSERDLAVAHGVNFALASVCRGIGSFSSGILFSFGVRNGYMILPFWTLAAWSLVNLALVYKIKE